jgi:hypothetical protein
MMTLMMEYIEQAMDVNIFKQVLAVAKSLSFTFDGFNGSFVFPCRNVQLSAPLFFR